MDIQNQFNFRVQFYCNFKTKRENGLVHEF